MLNSPYLTAKPFTYQRSWAHYLLCLSTIVACCKRGSFILVGRAVPTPMPWCCPLYWVQRGSVFPADF